nr:MAG TPA: hypothetical protein [Caudoviricetes sp.]
MKPLGIFLVAFYMPQRRGFKFRKRQRKTE